MPLTAFHLLLEAVAPPAAEAGAGAGGSIESILKRLWSIRSFFSQVDLEAEDSAAFREVLFRAFAAPRILASPTGRKLLAAFLVLSESTMDGGHAALKSLFPLAPRAQDWVAAV
jgi:hypothetical protein